MDAWRAKLHVVLHSGRPCRMQVNLRLYSVREPELLLILWQFLQLVQVQWFVEVPLSRLDSLTERARFNLKTNDSFLFGVFKVLQLDDHIPVVIQDVLLVAVLVFNELANWDAIVVVLVPMSGLGVNLYDG